MRFNMKECMKLEIVFASYFIEIFPVSECFRKEFGRININISVLNSLNEKGPNTVGFKIYYKKPSLYYNCGFANRTIFVIKRTFAT